MGLFGNFDKEGPGVAKDGPQKKRFFLFFELLGRKFSKLIILNIIYLITLIPLILGIYLSVKSNPSLIENGILNAENVGKVPMFVFSGDLVGLGLLIISLFLNGPVTCGFTYVIRNMQRQEHAWVFTDFREQFVKNYKQGLAMSVIDLLGTFLLYVAFCFYAYQMPVFMPGTDIIAVIAKYIIIIFSVIFLFMHYYLYTMLVTFNMKLKDILKNSVIFAIAKLPLNLFISIIIAVIVAVSITYFLPGVVAAIFFTLSLLGFIVVFSTYPTIDKCMIQVQFPDEDM